MKLVIREASINDAAAIAVLSNQLGYSISVPATLKNIETISKNPNEIIFVAAHEKVIGWIHVFQTTRLESGPFCEIGGLVVDNRNRGTGVGRLLLEQVKRWCISKGIMLLRVRTNIKRSEAHLFYIHTGFTTNKQQTVFEMKLSST